MPVRSSSLDGSRWALGTLLKVPLLWADPAVSLLQSSGTGAGPTPELESHSPARGQAVSSRGQGGSDVKEKHNLVSGDFLPPEKGPMQPFTAAGKGKSRWPCWPRFQPDCLGGVGGVQGGARSRECGGGEQEPPLAISLEFCPPGNRDVLQGLSVVFNQYLLELPGERPLPSMRTGLKACG